MSLTKLPSGRYRARIWVGERERPVAEILGLPKGTTWATKKEARNAYDDARRRLRTGGSLSGITVREFWERWTTDPLFSRPKESSNIHNRAQTKAFVEAYGNLPLRSIDDGIVSGWLTGGRRIGTVSSLRAMFNDAASAKAGRLIDRNPFGKLGISKGSGNRDVHPPSEEMVVAIIRAAAKRSFSYGAWLQVAAFTGMRPGELDALKWDCVDFERSRIHVAEQFSAKSRTFTLPKNGKRRWAILTPEAREVLEPIRKHNESEFCFVNSRRNHWTAEARQYQWEVASREAGYRGTLYLATRHFAGWWMINILGLDSEDVAIALGHEDGGELVRRLYGHRDKERALDRVLRAYEEWENVIPLQRKRATG